MAKVLISFLGTGPQIKTGQDKPNRDGYLKATYSIKDKIYKDKNFVADAIVEHHKIDKVIIAGTMKSIWEKFYEVFSKKEDNYDENFDLELWDMTHGSSHKTEINQDLIKRISKKLKYPVKPVIIHYGLEKTEFKKNFQLLVNAIEEDDFISNNDEVYLDITHAFRSIPIYMMMVLLYLRDVKPKKVKIQDILYGMYDVKWEMENHYSPIVSLKPTIEILDWIKGAYTFQHFGNGELIAKLLKKNNKKKLSTSIKNLSNAFGINYAAPVKREFEAIDDLDLNLEVPASLIVPKVISKFKNQFDNYETESQFQIELADWYAQNHLYDSAYILITEAIITFICEEEKYSDLSNKNNRDQAKRLIFNALRYNYINLDDWYNDINNIRKQIAHASIGRGGGINLAIKTLPERIERAKSIIYKTI